MIQKIDHIRSFGIYRNFQWGSLPPFTKFNLIYGWNYSGKTTLSRLFQLLEEPGKITSWPNSAFSVVMDDGSTVTHTLLNLTPKTRVFNRDFVLANFPSEHTAPAVFILGAQNAALRQHLEMLNRRLERVRRIDADFRQRTERAQNVISQLGTDKARDVAELLGDRNFRRPNLMRRVEEVRTTYAAFILNDADVTAKYEICRGTSAWTTLAVIQIALPDFVRFSEKIAHLLKQTASNRAIERLKSNRNLESWVRTGLELHQDSRECAFCGSTIIDARIEELKGHFSQEYEALVRDVTAVNQECMALRFDAQLLDERDFAPDLRTEYIALKERFQDWVRWASELQNEITDLLTQKQTQIESLILWEPDLSRSTEGGTLLGQINDLIERHNRMVAAQEQTRADAKTALERHYAALLFRDSDLLGKESQLTGLSNREAAATGVLGRVNVQITALELQVRQQSIGASNLNDVLRYLLAGNNIEVAAVGDGLFEFRRDGAPAANLSDGEKTAITFAYFLTSLEANGAVLADTIVFIDDPISSLDSNHIYAVYALISNRLSACHQVFVSTHNSELFNLMKDEWFYARQRYANNPNASAYYVSRSFDGNNQWIALLEDLPSLLRKYKSEYHFVFAQLHAFANAQTPSLHEAYTAPNLLRKFLEAYLGFRKPSISKWSAKLDILIATPVEQLEIQKFADDSSHLQGLTRALQQPNFITSAKRCVSMVIDGLRVNDFDHYESLCAVIGATP
ncbi:AAA family ATPase [Chlorobium phaeovibrioides]|uniref:AAA family ATPase n=1 Tax=Chlorobium phaeovibrioides TaxID=1094 RepID=A0A5M8IC22_CHLPH|nr:AAA family ATPase [Chlorobium phaeovibrioides]KAA6232943.1 AAA family ATPase [Chlorobium phaeovibrioides]